MNSRLQGRITAASVVGRALFAAAWLTLGLIVPAAHAATVDVVASGLANPRGIAFGAAERPEVDERALQSLAFTPSDRLFIAEAGTGAPMSGHITQLFQGKLERLLNMQSTLVQGGTDVSGPTSVASFGVLGGLVVTMGAGPGNPFGMLLGGNPSYAMFLADITGFELAKNPDGVIPPDSNPYSVAIVDERSVLVADAAANDLLYVNADGTIELVAVFPTAPNALFPAVGGPTVQAVPTSVTVGPDGAWYVGELRGFPFNNASHIWRIEPWARNVRCAIGVTSGPCIDWASGLRHVVGIAFGPDGNLYASQFGPGPGPGFLPGWSTPGAVVRVDAFTKAVSTVYSGLTEPGGIAVDAHGAIFVSNHSTSATDGEVVRITP